ncbi:putative membrane protein [Dactylococcopsis salina PCC 8305]|uniref:Membrane protein n=2 Tax=Dactylococcopsis salina TaxID=292566 RepID=K9YXC0_DACS8|nr:putative membrane protein [Dactylococcopsis salina PCC 8305]
MTEKRGIIVSAIIFFAITLVLILHRHFTFYSSYDQGIFNQVFWNGIHGDFFQSSLSSQLSTNVVHNNEVPEVYYHRLGQHFTPALLLWLPIYALFPYPATLSVLQVLFVTSAGIILYFLAREYVDNTVATLISISFYSANAILAPTLANFHDISQIPLFVFTLLLAMEKRWWWLFALFSVFILAVREDSGITLFGVGVYMILSGRFPRIGLMVCTVSFSYLLILTNLIMPIFSEDISKRFMLERFGQYVEGEEATTLDVIWAMLTQPWLLLRELVTPLDRTIRYLLGHLLPFAFIPTIAPGAWFIAGFPLLKLLLGKGFSVLAITIRYAMGVVPGLCYGAILWWGGQGILTFNQPLESLTPRPLSRKFRRFWLFCIGLTLFFTLTSNPNRTLYFLIPDSIDPLVYVSLPTQWERSGNLYNLMNRIPKQASVSTTTYIIPHLSGRREIIRFPALELRNDQREVETVEYVLADLWRLRRYQVAFDDDLARLKTMTAKIEAITDEGEYGIIDFREGIILLEKGAENNSQAVNNWLNFKAKIRPILQRED